MKFETLKLNKGKERAIQRRHPWIFSGAFKSLPDTLEDGAAVEVVDFKNNFVGFGLYRRASIAVSVLSFEPITNIQLLLETRIKEALGFRNALGLLEDVQTNCCRLIFAEGDGLSGLIVDKYDDTAVIQIHHPGWIPYLDLIAQIIADTGIVKHVYSKPSEKLDITKEHKGYLIGSEDDKPVLEYGHSFVVDWIDGQKTGFFLDQRENRQRLASLAKGKTVLNTFSYTGGFSVYALAAGASKVISVDSSESAIQLANQNAALNDLTKNHEGITSDVFEYLKQSDESFDIIILDPPAFSKNKRSTHNAIQAYKRLNRMGIEKVKSGGFIFTFSCSQHVDFKLFEDTIRAAAIEAQRPVRLAERLTQPKDHPVNLFHPEGEYLKGLILQVL